MRKAIHPGGPRILGIDPGLERTGYALVECGGNGPIVPEAGVIRGRRKELTARLALLHRAVVELLAEYRPSVMVVEQLYAHYAHPRTAIQMAHARGVILLAAAQAGVSTVSYNATTIKKTIAGSGRASKESVQRTIQRELRLTASPDPPDVADALAAALCHYYVHRDQAALASKPG
jgi:crossover junction endodeoxyribonuclease RuvC